MGEHQGTLLLKARSYLGMGMWENAWQSQGVAQVGIPDRGDEIALSGWAHVGRSI